MSLKCLCVVPVSMKYRIAVWRRNEQSQCRQKQFTPRTVLNLIQQQHTRGFHCFLRK